MGYRSDVAYAIQFGIPRWVRNNGEVEIDEDKPKNLFYTFLSEAKSKPETAKCFDERENLDIDENKFRILFKAEGVKWYESYEDVVCHEALLELAQEYIDQVNGDGSDNSPYLSWNFVRIGEEMDDSEERVGGNGLTDEYFWITRAIEWNV